MNDATQRTLNLLREMNVSEAEFHADGSLARVVFAPDTSLADVHHETPAPMKRMRSVGGVVPRVVVDGE